MCENCLQSQVVERSESFRASSEDLESAVSECSCKHLESNVNKHKEKEQLNSFLLSLTTHCAQVQFRLRQVINAPAEEKDKLLKSLEEFASQGVTDIPLMKTCIDEVNLVEEMRLRRKQQQDIIGMLKLHMLKLEDYICPSSKTNMIQKHRQVLNINHCEIFHNEFNMQINISNSPEKEHFVNQLKIQVADLEKFVLYLQDKTKKSRPVCKSKTSLSFYKIMKLLQVFVSLQVGYGFFKQAKLHHDYSKDIHNWKNLTARLEIAITNVKDLLEQSLRYKDQNEEYLQLLHKLTTNVRDNLALAIRNLIQHGTCIHSRFILTRFLCRNTFRSSSTHAWDVVLKYYHLKNGESYNLEPLNTLSDSFQLDLIDAEHLTAKHNLLCCISYIISMHDLYKRDAEARFKAFICAALNSRELVNWLSLIFKCKKIARECYLPWSYIRQTGFKDALANLDILMTYKFDLPIDFDVQEFQNIQDVIN